MLKGFVKRFYGLRFNGDYPSWDIAARKATGYNTDAVVKAAYSRAQKVGSEKAPAWLERFGQLIDEYRPARVLDFGGAMGHAYFLLGDRVKGVHWYVVDLPKMVEAAADFATDHLHFSTDLNVPKPDLVVAAGSLQYCPDPRSTLRELTAFGVPVVVERCPIWRRDRLCIQTVPKPRSSYPVWFLADTFKGCRWLSNERVWLDGKQVEYYGFLLGK